MQLYCDKKNVSNRRKKCESISYTHGNSRKLIIILIIIIIVVVTTIQQYNDLFYRLDCAVITLSQAMTSAVVARFPVHCRRTDYRPINSIRKCTNNRTYCYCCRCACNRRVVHHQRSSSPQPASRPSPTVFVAALPLYHRRSTSSCTLAQPPHFPYHLYLVNVALVRADINTATLPRYQLFTNIRRRVYIYRGQYSISDFYVSADSLGESHIRSDVRRRRRQPVRCLSRYAANRRAPVPVHDSDVRGLVLQRIGVYTPL